MLRTLTLAALALTFAAPAMAVPVGTSADTRPAAPQQRPQWKDGGLSLQLTGNYLRGNVNLSTLNTSWAAHVTRGQHSLFLDAGNFFTGTDTTTLVNRLSGSALYAFAAEPDVNWYAYSTHSHDQSIKLDYRMTAGLGACRHQLLAPDFSLFLVSLNPAFEYERFRPGVEMSAWRGVLRVNAVRPIAEGTEFGFDTFYTPNLANFGDYRLYGEVYTKHKLLGDVLSLRLSAADEYDSMPVGGVQANDFGVFSTIMIEWGQ